MDKYYDMIRHQWLDEFIALPITLLPFSATSSFACNVIDITFFILIELPIYYYIFVRCIIYV